MTTQTDINVVSHLTDTFFGGTQKRFCEFVGRQQSTIATWKQKNLIPADVTRLIIARSDAEGLGISPNDFFPDRLKVEV